MRKLFFIAFAFIVSINSSYSQLVINEFLASNTGDFIDPDFNESADWFEIVNVGATALDLSNFFFTDNLSDSIKWKPEESIDLLPGQFYIFWADGRNQTNHPSFKLSADGEELGIFDLQGNLIDSLTYKVQETNVSMGRNLDGTGEWVYFIDPTPGASNDNSSYGGIVKSEPYFSVLGGIFDHPTTIEIKNLFEGEIRYTLDGSEPTVDALIYENPITVSNNTVVRARVFNGNEIPGPTITHSYFIDNDNIDNLPIISISSEPENFWDNEMGIYVQDFKPDWEIPINIEIFENDGSDRAGFNLKAGAKVNGLYSWQLPQKMLGIYFRKDYGKGKLEYPMFKNSDRVVFDSFSLRASGSDWSYTLFRDALGQSLTEENMKLDFQDYKPCVVYFNGEYMGIHNLRPKIDRDIVWYANGLDGVDVDVIENESNPDEGTLNAYNSFQETYTQDLSIDTNYDSVLSMMDEENFTDYMIAEMYVRNSSLDHNVFTWKPVVGGEWKWILGDLDRGFFKPTESFVRYFENEGHTPFEALMANTKYKKYFGRRMADQLFTTYNPVRVAVVIDEFKDRISSEIERHIERWQGTTSSYGNAIPSFSFWEDKVSALKTFANQRPSSIIESIQDLGFGPPLALSIKISPAAAGIVYFNGLKCLTDMSNGAYFQNETINLLAEAKPGYDFVGWGKQAHSNMFETGAAWKYNDSGIGTDNWSDELYDDSGWSVGNGQFGYGDNDETTTLDYGSDSRNKHITYYFRKSFELSDPSNIISLGIGLMCDDGAVIYINGVEVLRQNITNAPIDASTLASSTVGGASESALTYYTINSEDVTLKTSNVIAVEVHQSVATSSDISFDMNLSSIQNSVELLTSSASYDYLHSEKNSLTALFERNNRCILPAEINEELVLDLQCSPYYVPETSTITETGSLIVPSGVELLFSNDVSLIVNGKLTVNGESVNPVYFRSDPNSVKQKWGIVNIVNADTCLLENLIIEDASKGASRITQNAAISIFNSVVNMDHLTIENVHSNPIAARYSDVSLTNSFLHSKVTGDLINIKYGKGYIDNCEFEGNSMPDTDAIDYDDIENGVIKNSIIRNFNGFNSDAIDIGEQAKNILIENVFVYNITDKGVSVGQQSSAQIQNSIFMNCNLGAGLKDSSKVTIDHCTYYACVIPIACYEKNAGSAGGNAWVTSTILSNAYDESYLVDEHSFLTFSNSLSDSDTIRIGSNNLYANPQFEAPDYSNFNLLATSPAINKGLNGNMGASQEIPFSKSGIAITGINTGELTEALEYLVLSNIGETPLDVSGYQLNDGVQFTFGENMVIDAGENIFITNNKSHISWEHAKNKVFEWEEGKLDNNGEKVALVADNKMFVDQVRYRNQNPWPILSAGETFLSLETWGSDNHIPENWTIQSLAEILLVNAENNVESVFKMYPNPTNGLLNLIRVDAGTALKIYDLSGVLVYETTFQNSSGSIDLTNLPNGFYFVKIGSQVQKISKR